MRNLILSTFAVAAILVAVGALSASAHAGESFTPNRAADLVATLEVSLDGTLAVHNPVEALAILGDDWPAARAELERLNAGIRGGRITPFGVDDDLGNYQIIDRGSCSSSGQGTPQSSPFSVQTEAVACRCDRGCCSRGTCCKRGWWIFCWQIGGC